MRSDVSVGMRRDRVEELPFQQRQPHDLFFRGFLNRMDSTTRIYRAKVVLVSRVHLQIDSLIALGIGHAFLAPAREGMELGIDRLADLRRGANRFFLGNDEQSQVARFQSHAPQHAGTSNTYVVKRRQGTWRAPRLASSAQDGLDDALASEVELFAPVGGEDAAHEVVEAAAASGSGLFAAVGVGRDEHRDALADDRSIGACCQ